MTVEDDEKQFEHLYHYTQDRCAKFADLLASEDGENFYEMNAVDVVFWLEKNSFLKEEESKRNERVQNNTI
jgi:hypothetical protein|tara:strand:+ start:5064 stop:5276 length:213 start_codon:yes stop_codon:yes gene_type:complete